MVFNGVARTFPAHKHGRGKRGRNLKISAKNAVFLVSSGKKTNFTTFGPPWKKTSDAHAHKHVKLDHFLQKCVVLYYTIWQHCSATPMR